METKTENRTKRANNRGAVLMTHDGRIYNVPYHGGGLPELYRLINCSLVEAVRLGAPYLGLSVWCDEEGKLKPHGVNRPASLLYRILCGGDYMAGRCVVLADNPETGDTEPLTDEQRASVYRFFDLVRDAEKKLGYSEAIEATGPRCEIVEL